MPVYLDYTDTRKTKMSLLFAFMYSPTKPAFSTAEPEIWFTISRLLNMRRATRVQAHFNRFQNVCLYHDGRLPIGGWRPRGQNNFARSLVSSRDVLLKIAVGRVNKTRTARNCRVQPRLDSQIFSTVGGGLVEILVAQARHDEAIVEKIRIAVRRQDKDRVFALAKELIQKDEPKTAQSRIARPRQHC